MSEDFIIRTTYSLFSPIPNKLFADNKREINRVNASLLGTIGIIGMLIFVCLIGLITISKRDPHNPFYNGPYYVGIYGGLFLVCTVIMIYCRFISEKHPFLILPLYYLIFIALIIYSTINRFIAVPNGQVFTFEFVMLMMPVVLIDKSWRIVLFELLFLGTFTFFDFKYQGRLPRFLWRDDLANMLISTAVGLIGGRAVRSSRIQALENGRIYILQRNTDELTKLSNRRKLFHELRKSSDGRSAPIKCLFIADLDFFKKYNDTFGHPAGDEVLGKIGECFTKFNKTSGFEMFRYGGEEFVGLYRLEEDIDYATTIHGLCKAVRDLKIERALPNMPYITISIGFAIASKAQPSGYEPFISMADSALYAAKSHGRNCAVEFSPTETPLDDPYPDATTQASNTPVQS